MTKNYTPPASGLLGDQSRDRYLTDFGKATLKDRYLFTNETYQDLFVRVASAYADDAEHAKRLYNYMSLGWFMPATPVLSNGGTDRGLPISCFLNSVEDSLDGISSTWNESIWLAARGGGIGTYWGHVRPIGDAVGDVGETSGVIPFIRVQDSLTSAISQGSLRRGSSAAYLDMSHPEIDEFMKIRRVQGGDPRRKALDLHNGVVISDEFMQCVIQNKPWDLINPRTKEVVETVSARELWNTLLEVRLETGEPYIVFSDTVNKNVSEVYKKLGLGVKQSNLCSEIMLHTGLDHLGNDRTAVCCLSSVNIEEYESWSQDPLFIEDIYRFLDNVLEDFIKKTEGVQGFEKARYSAMRERSVGLGAMGFHSFLQKNSIPFEGVMAKVWNMKIFTHLRAQADAASRKLAEERGACPDAIEAGLLERFAHKLAIAPTASISIICRGTSPGIEPWLANVFVHKTLSGTFVVRNKYLEAALDKYGQNNDDVWTSITTRKGSVQHLEFMDQHDKDVFKTAHELDQNWLIDHGADRSLMIDQGQSLNLFIEPEINKGDLLKYHVRAWKKGLKSLYYVRSMALSRTENISEKVEQASTATSIEEIEMTGSDECLACQ